MKIGAQLYTVRDFAQNLEDFENTIARIAEIGYREVQVSGTCAYEPEWLAEKLSKYGLSCVLTHTAMDKMKADPVGVCRDHSVFGCNYIGIGSIPGAMLGGVLLGLVEKICLSIPVLAPYTTAIEFSLLIIILLVKPSGFLGKKRNEKV